ncbi:MAG: hypothetical protein NVSMB38_09380 [Ktedonobacteraceae bacterium]
MHETPNDPHGRKVRWVIGCIAVNHPVQGGDAFGILGGCPAHHQSIA